MSYGGQLISTQGWGDLCPPSPTGPSPLFPHHTKGLCCTSSSQPLTLAGTQTLPLVPPPQHLYINRFATRDYIPKVLLPTQKKKKTYARRQREQDFGSQFVHGRCSQPRTHTIQWRVCKVSVTQHIHSPQIDPQSARVHPHHQTGESITCFCFLSLLSKAGLTEHCTHGLEM